MHHDSHPTPDARLIAAIGSAAILGALALQNAADARRAEREHPPRGRIVAGAGARLHVLDAGAGAAPPAVLLHGNGVRAEDWVGSGVLGRLARDRRVLAFDRPGFGFSDRPRDRVWGAGEQAAAFAEALDRLDAGPAVVVAQSWGTLAAIALALNHPQAVAGLVLIGGYHYPVPRADTVIFSPPALPVVGDVLRYTAAPVAGRLIAPAMVRHMFAPRPVPPRFEAAMPRAMMLRPWQIRASAEDAATMTPRAAEAMERYAELARVKVAILAGAEDGIVDPVEHSARLHGDIPGSTLRVVPGLGHMMHWSAPELVAEAVREVGEAAPSRVRGLPAPLAEAAMPEASNAS